MRYIYAVAGLILIVLGISGITFLRKGTPASKELARINERIITTDEFKRLLEESKSVPSSVDRRRFLDDLLLREILIQEAKKRGLDLKEPFRRSIQNYYEQTLLKSLAQERMSEIVALVDEEEIAKYYKNMGKVYELSIAVLPSEARAEEAVRNFPPAKVEKRRLRMEEIPPAIADAVTALKVGEVSGKPVPCDAGFYVFRLDAVASVPVPSLGSVHNEIKRTLEERKKTAEMEKWLSDLKKKSRIHVNEALLK